MWCYGQGRFRVRVIIRGRVWVGLELSLPNTLTLTLDPNDPFHGMGHGKSSQDQVEKNKLSNSAMKTSIYYFCIAYLIRSKFF